jgi:hypothetical protein
MPVSSVLPAPSFSRPQTVHPPALSPPAPCPLLTHLLSLKLPLSRPICTSACPPQRPCLTASFASSASAWPALRSGCCAVVADDPPMPVFRYTLPTYSCVAPWPDPLPRRLCSAGSLQAGMRAPRCVLYLNGRGHCVATCAPPCPASPAFPPPLAFALPRSLLPVPTQIRINDKLATVSAPWLTSIFNLEVRTHEP